MLLIRAGLESHYLLSKRDTELRHSLSAFLILRANKSDHTESFLAKSWQRSG